MDSSWSEWDQDQRNHISKLLAAYYAKQPNVKLCEEGGK
jgi:hypothetical protein